MLVSMDVNGKQCWASKIREVLSRSGFYFVWLFQGVGDINKFLRLFKQRLIDMFVQEWSATVHDSERYETYRSYKSVFATESYLSEIEPYCFRVALTQLRMGVLPINNNMFRYSGNHAARNCPFCLTAIEDERHFLFVCPLYVDLRARLLTDLSTMSVSSVLRWEENSKCFSMVKYIFLANKRRNLNVEA
jgi:hypothetical protein